MTIKTRITRLALALVLASGFVLVSPTLDADASGGLEGNCANWDALGPRNLEWISDDVLLETIMEPNGYKGFYAERWMDRDRLLPIKTTCTLSGAASLGGLIVTRDGKQMDSCPHDTCTFTLTAVDGRVSQWAIMTADRKFLADVTNVPELYRYYDPGTYMLYFNIPGYEPEPEPTPPTTTDPGKGSQPPKEEKAPAKEKETKKDSAPKKSETSQNAAAPDSRSTEKKGTEGTPGPVAETESANGADADAPLLEVEVVDTSADICAGPVTPFLEANVCFGLPTLVQSGVRSLLLLGPGPNFVV